MIKSFIWFWKESKKYTGYRGLELIIKGLKPCFKFMYYEITEK